MTETTSPTLFKGYWFLPSNPDRQVAGVLTVEPDGRAILEMLGSFEEVRVLGIDVSNQPAIWGQCYDADRKKGISITLLNCSASWRRVATGTTRTIRTARDTRRWWRRASHSSVVLENTLACLPSSRWMPRGPL